ncbi:MAG: VWA domain-containing protein, partial [bacterium]|nr:VWA domain-containing protein [bacterium]
MVLVHPTALWLLLLLAPLAVALAALQRRRGMGLGRLHAGGVILLRLLGFTLLVAALAQPVIERPDPSRTVVAAVDISSSISDGALSRAEAALADLASRRAPGDVFKLVVFDARAHEVEADSVLHQPGVLAGLRRGATVPPPGSVPAEALDLAAALIPHDGRGQVLLFGDGLETAGDTLAAADRLARRGIGVEVVAPAEPPSDEVVLCALSAPASAGVGATIVLRAQVESST